jgi:hypothetical protein
MINNSPGRGTVQAASRNIRHNPCADYLTCDHATVRLGSHAMRGYRDYLILREAD